MGAREIFTHKIAVFIFILNSLGGVHLRAFLNNNEDWMGQLPYNLTTVSLNLIAIPGSHDSGTDGITENSLVSPDEPEFLERFDGIPLAIEIIARFSITQNLTFQEQLEAGIRYFDMRVCYNKEMPDDPYWLCHGLFAVSLKKSLLAFKQFLQQHPKEIVLLDFNHVYALNQSQVLELQAWLQSFFGANKLVPPNNSVENITLQNLWAKQQQVWIFFITGTNSQYNVWDSNYVLSPWPQTAKNDIMIQFNENNYNAGRSKTMMYVNQGILTPNLEAVITHLFGGLKTFVYRGTEMFVEWMKGKTIGKPNTAGNIVGINICIIDFVLNFDYINQVILLNYK